MARRALSLLTLLAAEALAVATLHGLGRVDGLGGPGTDPAGWLASASPEAVVAGGLRLTALALAWWLLATTLLYALAHITRLPAAMRAVRWAVLPGARGLVERALGVSLLTTVALGAAGLGTGAASADEPPPATVPSVVVEQDRRPQRDEPVAAPEVRGGRALETVPDPAPPTAPPAPDPSPVPAEPAPPPAASPPTPPAPIGAPYVVAPGDSLWTIAANRTAGDEVDAYWTRLVDANRDTLRSGNPNLIYPGEVLELPPL